MTANEWAIITGLVGAVVALVGYIYRSLDARVAIIDHPTTGSLVQCELRLRETLHKHAAIIQQHAEMLARHDENSDSMRSDIHEVKECQREIRDLLVAIQIKLGILTP